MTKYECAAHISEKGTIDGAKGDQTGHEVSISQYSNYSPGGYNIAMRYTGKSAKLVRNRIVKAARRFAISNRVGYSQYSRNTLYEQMQKFNWYLTKCKKISKCNADCSSFVGVVVNVALCPLKLASPIPADIFTGTEYDYLRDRGFTRVKNVDFTTGKGLIAGDILINYKYHTTIFFGDKYYGDIADKDNESKTKEDKKALDIIAEEVADGKWGNGDDRKSRLKAAGYDYDEIQARVNQLLGLDGC